MSSSVNVNQTVALGNALTMLVYLVGSVQKSYAVKCQCNFGSLANCAKTEPARSPFDVMLNQHRLTSLKALCTSQIPTRLRRGSPPNKEILNDVVLLSSSLLTSDMKVQTSSTEAVYDSLGTQQKLQFRLHLSVNMSSYTMHDIVQVQQNG